MIRKTLRVFVLAALLPSVALADLYIVGPAGSGASPISGSGTQNVIAKFSVGGVSIEDSSLTDDGTAVTSTVPIVAPAGSAAAPSLTFAGDTDSGFYSVSNNVIGLSEGGILRHQFTPTQLAIVSATGGIIIGGDTTIARTSTGIVGVTTGIALGTNPAQSGAVRLAHGASVVARNSANTVDSTIWSYGVRAVDQIAFGATNRNTRVSSNLATPASLLDGDWWVECVGTTPSRICAIKVRDGGVTQTIADITI